ncbi:short-chain dehydrogenase/reductase (plasmid) [Mycolicibacterium arabiense]|uniref:Short-chain dehydrogenase/reductase n=1 Tax=Mycolicibacterium arabiense TaxID=1286181 RepID=A0A7I7RR73_9MYCO|nr:SDR family NAD(P)-dependent oxidoreductase [Mycolicibacterium arabiense]MCV7371970.1 SDR family NAD(P)-dependent oxidoreductase [Mycolicibacterium arabiense]BBY46711.1 short-chain dehydrogenase/reductase [Mycolicibacterium arabiense]
MSKVWFITGASRGFGWEWTLAALRRGDRVAATARDLTTLRELSVDYHDSLLPLVLDVTDESAASAAVRAAHEHFGQLDVVVNNAGYGLYGFVEEPSSTQVREQMEVNFFGALWVTRAALPYLRAQRSGHFIQVSSGAGLVTAARFGLYSASKHALEAVSEALAQEVGPQGISVTLVEPGPYATGFNQSVTLAAEMPEYVATHREAERALGDFMGAQGDPATTTAVILEVVDAAEPPLRVLLGPTMFDFVRSEYEQRLDTWTRWESRHDETRSPHGDQPTGLSG